MKGLSSFPRKDGHKHVQELHADSLADSVYIPYKYQLLPRCRPLRLCLAAGRA